MSFLVPAGEDEVIKINMAFAERNDYTIQDVDTLFEDEQRAELIDGRICLLASQRLTHQRIQTALGVSLIEYIRLQNGACQVFMVPMDVYLNQDNKTRVQPDIFVICDPDKIREDACYGAPDLVIEIISKSTKKNDYGVKMLKYRTAGVREYWIIDPYLKTVLVFWFEDERENCSYSFDEEIPFHLFPNLSVRIADMVGGDIPADI